MNITGNQPDQAPVKKRALKTIAKLAVWPTWAFWKKILLRGTFSLHTVGFFIHGSHIVPPRGRRPCWPALVETPSLSRVNMGTKCYANNRAWKINVNACICVGAVGLFYAVFMLRCFYSEHGVCSGIIMTVPFQVGKCLVTNFSYCTLKICIDTMP